jgi:hypothetical protein
MLPRLLIVGDSFSADVGQQSWTKKLPGFAVTNLSTNGSSEYRIFKKLVNTDLKEFEYVIIVHTSPYRIYIEHNPLHLDSLTHQECDLLYQDIKSADLTKFTQNVAWYFENVFDLEQANIIHNLLIEKIVTLTTNHHALHLSFFKDEKNDNITNLSSIWKQHSGSINHMDEIGNDKVAILIKTTYNNNNTKDLL